MHSNGNGITDKPWDCAVDGHDWVDTPDVAIVPQRCCHCPAIGAYCPECCGLGVTPAVDEHEGEADCSRCGATGTIEVVEIAAAAVERLRKTEKRFGWLLKEFCHQSRSRPSDAIREIDELLAMGASCGKIDGVPLADVAKASRTKKPSAGSHRTRATGNTPGVVPDESSIAEKRDIQ